MKLDEQILRELETERTALPAHIGSVESVVSRGKRRKTLTTAVGALAGVAVVSFAVGVTAWLGGTGTESDVVGQAADTWTTYTVAEGLTSDCACDMTVAADGTLWAVASDGASRFDGSAWILEPFPPGFAFADGTVAVAPDGSIWFAGGDPNGAARYYAGSWTVIEPHDHEMWGGFNDIAIAGDGTVWVTEGDFLTRLVGDVFELVDAEFQPMPGHETPLSGSPVGNASIEVDPDGTLWTVGGPIDGKMFLFSLAGDAGLVSIEMGGQGPGTVLGVDPDGAIWFSAQFYRNTASGDESVLLQFDGQAWTSYPIGGVVDAAFEPDGTAWFVVDEVTGDETMWRLQYSEPGAYRFDGDVWTHFTLEDGLAGLDLTSVITTADGSTWFGTGSNGITRYQHGTSPTSGVELELTGVPQSADQWPAWPSTTDAPAPTTAVP